MRLQVGDLPTAEGRSPEALGLQVIRAPSPRASYWLAAVVGMAVVSVLCVGSIIWSSAFGDRGGMSTAGDAAAPWVPMLIVLVVFVPLHELLHLLGQPGWGLSSRSVLAVWPAKLRFGVYYEGCMSRRRWLAMRLMPLVVLSVLPACVVALLQTQAWRPELEIGLQVMMVVNALGSGADVVAGLLVISQVPPTAQLCFQAGRAYWRPA